MGLPWSAHQGACWIGGGGGDGKMGKLAVRKRMKTKCLFKNEGKKGFALKKWWDIETDDPQIKTWVKGKNNATETEHKGKWGMKNEKYLRYDSGACGDKQINKRTMVRLGRMISLFEKRREGGQLSEWNDQSGKITEEQRKWE